MTDESAAKVHHGGVHDLGALADELVADAERSGATRSGRTLVTVGPLRMTVVALAAGAQMSEHENPGAATVHVLAGACRLVAGDLVVDLEPGALVQVPDRRHSLSTDAGCVVLLTVALVDRTAPPA